MRNVTTLLVRLFALALLMFLSVLVFAGGPDTIPTAENPFLPGTNARLVFDWYAVVYGGVLTALTYVQAAFFPKAGKVPKVAVRYLIIAVATAGIFIVLGFTDGIGVFIGFIGSALTYDKVLSPLGLKTPQPKTS